MNLKDIETAYQLINAFPQHTLRISADASLKKKWNPEHNDHTLPEDDLLMRYESDVNRLYVDPVLFDRYEIPEVSELLRRNSQYVGAKLKRMLKGVDVSGYPRHGRRVYMFDLNKVSASRAEEKRARGRPENHKEQAEDIIQKAETVFDRAHAGTKIIQKKLKLVADELNHPRNSEQPKFWRDTQKEMIAVLEQCLFLLDIGKNLHAEVIDLAHRYNTPLKRTSRKVRYTSKYVDKSGKRARNGALEHLVQLETKFIHREVFYWSDKTGMLQQHKREYLPEIEPGLYSGYYKETSRSDGTGLQKTLWIPIALLNTYTHRDSTILSPEEKEELKYFRNDTRFVSFHTKRIGGKVCRCAKFDMTRTVNVAGKEPPREPEKRKRKEEG